MHYYLVAPTIIAHGEHPFLTYESETEFSIGCVVVIEVGKKSCIGVVYKSVDKPSFPTKAISESIPDTAPLPRHLLELAEWMSGYYATHLAVVLQTLLPRGLNKKRRKISHENSHPLRERTNIVLNVDQQTAITTINNTKEGSLLLRGVTGSGKTQVYIEAAKEVVSEGKSVIVLVPEIALTSQLVAEFSQHFDNTTVTHSTMTEAERHHVWLKCINNTEPQVVIGPRSAIFSPLQNLGLIIIDECHESTYKQDQSPRYSALRVASMIARFAHIKAVFGSATPTAADTYLALNANRPVLLMPQSAQKDVARPDMTVVDMTKKESFGRHRFFSNELLASIEQSLKEGTQSLVFHNRRGSAPLTLCDECGWMASCPECYLPLTLHADKHKMICHTCGLKGPVPPNCPLCKEPDIVHKGVGTKQITDELSKQFPHARIARFDADTEKPEQLHKLYQPLYDGQIDIIVGTQVIAKGLDLPHLRTVGIVQADGGLNIPDYQSEERVFQLIYQVAGRVGRNRHKTKVIVQTYQPKHPSVQLGIARDYDAFYEHTIAERKRAFFPPYCHLLKLTCSYATERSAVNATTKLAEVLKSNLGGRIRILGPAPSFYERMGNSYRWQLIIKSTSRQHLIEAARLTPKQHWFIDLDPANLL